MSDHLQNEGEGVMGRKPMPEKAMGTTETVRCTARPGEQGWPALTPIPMDIVMRSDTCRMHMEQPEAGMEAAQIVTDTVIEQDESEFSIFFSLPSMASLSMLNAALMPSEGGKLNGKLYRKLPVIKKWWAEWDHEPKCMRYIRKQQTEYNDSSTLQIEAMNAEREVYAVG